MGVVAVDNVDLNALLTKWRWLVPADVDVHIKYGDCDGAFADCQCVLELNRLFIRVSPVDYMPENHAEFGLERDIEADIVHELVHWRMEAFKPEDDGASYRLWEAAVERTAQDLIRLDRGE